MQAGPGDISAITSLLKESELPYEDVGLAGRDFIVATEKGKVVG